MKKSPATYGKTKVKSPMKKKPVARAIKVRPRSKSKGY